MWGRAGDAILPGGFCLKGRRTVAWGRVRRAQSEGGRRPRKRIPTDRTLKGCHTSRGRDTCMAAGRSDALPVAAARMAWASGSPSGCNRAPRLSWGDVRRPFVPADSAPGYCPPAFQAGTPPPIATAILEATVLTTIQHGTILKRLSLISCLCRTPARFDDGKTSCASSVDWCVS